MDRNSAIQVFAKLLAGHLKSGTRPKTANGEPWTYEEFAGDVLFSNSEKYVSPGSVANWCKGKTLPRQIEPLLNSLFGSADRHANNRLELRSSYMSARDASTKVIAETEIDPAGGIWIEKENEQFVLDNSSTRPDQTAAADPLLQQLQNSVRKSSMELAEAAKGLANTKIWRGLAKAATDFHKVVAGDYVSMPARLGDAYALLLSLGRYLETNNRIENNPLYADATLDPEVRGALVDLVHTGAPWLRGFPTVAKWDDEAGKALSRADLFDLARQFAQIARSAEAISAEDAAQIELLSDAAGEDGLQGQKASARTIAHAKNLLLSEALAITASLGSDEKQSLSVQRAIAAFASSKIQIKAMTAPMPDDIRQALLSLVDDPSPVRGNTPATIAPAHRKFPAALQVWREAPFCTELAIIPAGSFWMGAQDGDYGTQPDELPAQYITLCEFGLGRFAVTNKEFSIFAEETRLPPYSNITPDDQALDDHPVRGVDWKIATQYCAWLNEKLNLDPGTYRLPSESEWEYAARAGTTSTYIWEASARYSEFAHFSERQVGTIPVYQKKANPWGLHQMFGNVWEWCSDEYVPTLKGIPKDGSPRMNSKSQTHVVRGSSWYSDGGNTLRAAHRGKPDYKWMRARTFPSPRSSSLVDSIGFRIARTLDPN